LQNKPFVFALPKRPTETEEQYQRRSFLDKYEGYAIDLVQELSKLKSLKFKYEFQLVGDGKYGSKSNGEWNGMIRELRDKVRPIKY